ncbi:MAG TPA: hypothetical protein DCX06_10995 [Opitutae bacterium]|nr:hypothetical protein [Opitutae bacterium]
MIDRDTVIDNDGIHGMKQMIGSHHMKLGRRRFRLSYFQGSATVVG